MSVRFPAFLAFLSTRLSFSVLPTFFMLGFCGDLSGMAPPLLGLALLIFGSWIGEVGEQLAEGDGGESDARVADAEGNQQ